MKALDFLFGKKYYLNICTDGITDFVASTPFSSLKEAKDHRDSLRGNRSVSYVGRVSFRTREKISLRGK